MEYPILGEEWGSNRPPKELGAQLPTTEVNQCEGKPRQLAGQNFWCKKSDKGVVFAEGGQNTIDHPDGPSTTTSAFLDGTKSGNVLDNSQENVRKVEEEGETTAPPVDVKCSFTGNDVCVVHGIKASITMVSSKKWEFIVSKQSFGWKYRKVKKLSCRHRGGDLSGHFSTSRTPTLIKHYNSEINFPGEGDSSINEKAGLANFGVRNGDRISDQDVLEENGLAKSE